MPAKGGASQARARVSTGFVIVATVLSSLIAFFVGKLAREILVDGPAKTLLQEQNRILMDHAAAVERLRSQRQHASATVIGDGAGDGKAAGLPLPVVPKGKRSPNTIYTSKNFDTSQSSSTKSRWVVQHQDGADAVAANAAAAAAAADHCEASDEDGSCVGEAPTEQADEADDDDEEDDENDDEDGADGDEEVHLPAGQHLLIDLDGLDASFLDSEERLATAMLDLVNECGLTLLSYHCHGLQPSGVSCVGVLLESHVSLHTWPSHGVITLDLFTCGPNSLLPVVSSAERLFSVAASPGVKPTMIWAHKTRGFPDMDSSSRTADLMAVADLEFFPIGRMMEYKEQIASEKTPFQTIDIYDVVQPEFTLMESFRKAMQTDVPSYESEHPQLFQPDRIVFLDGVLQSRSKSDAAYHETLVHPGIFTHPNPKRVAIIGGGEGATLRETLKHRTVEEVVMIEIDEMMVNVSRKYLPQWSDCSNLVGSADSCFDDPRTTMCYEDAKAWFLNRYLNTSDGEQQHEKFDVIIMDALDPQNDVGLAAELYSNSDFYTSIYNALSDNGVLISQIGETDRISDPADQFTRDSCVADMVDRATDVGFKNILNYEEGHCGFMAPWSFFIALKDYNSRSDWFANEATVTLKMRQRLMRVKGGEASPLLFFDGATMKQLQYPSKAMEVVHCRRIPQPEECKDDHGLNPDNRHHPIDVLEVRQSSVSENAGRGVFTKVDLKKNEYVGMDRLVHAVYMEPATHDLMTAWYENEHWNWDYHNKAMEGYTHGYGHLFGDHGGTHAFVDASLHTFINHACNAQNNMGHDISVTETNVSPDDPPPDEIQRYTSRIYSPFTDRQMHFYSAGHARRDISAGEELTDNYLALSGIQKGFWKEELKSLRAVCAGEHVGRVTAYESGKDEKDNNEEKKN